MECHIDDPVWHLDVGSSHPGAGEDSETSLPRSNPRVINWLITVESSAKNFGGGLYRGKTSEMTEVEKAYVAGFLDGDGSIMAHIEPHRECRFGYRIRVVIKFSQHESSSLVLAELKRLCGGYLSQANKHVRELAIKSSTNVECFLKEVAPYVRVKRTQAEQALRLIEELRQVKTLEDFKGAARLADQISQSNLKSRSRRKHFSQTLTLSP